MFRSLVQPLRYLMRTSEESHHSHPRTDAKKRLFYAGEVQVVNGQKHCSERSFARHLIRA